MKIGKLLLTAVIALGLMACNNEEGPNLSVEKEASISIKVFPSSKSPSVRATGDLSGNGILSPGLAAESAIKQLEVWIFKGDVLDGYKSANATEVTDIEAHIGARTVVVVANAGIGLITSKATLLATLKTLPADVASNGLVMTAEPIDVTLTAGNNYYGYTDAEVTAKTGENKNHLNDGKSPLAITRVNARVAIVNATLDYTNVPANQKVAFDELKDVEVAMFNVPEKTKLFGTSLATNTDYLFGAKWPSPSTTYVGANDPAATATAGLTDAVANALPIVTTNAPYYYVNEECSEAGKMFIVLRAKVYKEGNVVTTLKELYTDENGYTYYPVWVNKDGLTTAGTVGDGNVYRNTQYNITLTIKGLGNPTIDEVEKAWLDVKVEVAPWAVVNQDVTW